MGPDGNEALHNSVHEGWNIGAVPVTVLSTLMMEHDEALAWIGAAGSGGGVAIGTNRSQWRHFVMRSLVVKLLLGMCMP